MHDERVTLQEAARQRYWLPHPLALLVLVIMMFGMAFAVTTASAAGRAGDFDQALALASEIARPVAQAH